MTTFDVYAERHGLTLPQVVAYDEFSDVAHAFGLMEVDEFLAAEEVTVLGAGDERYLRRADLLRACGDDCAPEDGWGYLLSKLLVRKYSER